MGAKLRRTPTAVALQPPQWAWVLPPARTVAATWEQCVPVQVAPPPCPVHVLLDTSRTRQQPPGDGRNISSILCSLRSTGSSQSALERSSHGASAGLPHAQMRAYGLGIRRVCPTNPTQQTLRCADVSSVCRARRCIARQRCIAHRRCIAEYVAHGDLMGLGHGVCSGPVLERIVGLRHRWALQIQSSRYRGIQRTLGKLKQARITAASLR